MLRWPINSRSTLTDGLYPYDALARLRDIEATRRKVGETGTLPAEDIGELLPARPAGHRAATRPTRRACC